MYTVGGEWNEVRSREGESEAAQAAVADGKTREMETRVKITSELGGSKSKLSKRIIIGYQNYGLDG